MVLWMSDAAAARGDEADRHEWYQAALAGKRALVALHEKWGVRHEPWYADNTREPLRDEIFRAWSTFGAIARYETLQTTSSTPQWSLTADFAALFDPSLGEDAAAESIADWREDHLGTIGLARVAVAEQIANAGSAISVNLPNGLTRALAPGGTSLILKGVIERFAPRVLAQPAVLFISESRQHVDLIDAQLLRRLGMAIKADRLLPDALLFDVERGEFWFVEVVFSDGPIDEARRNALLNWAESQGIPVEQCRFLTAFAGRTSASFRRLAASLAWGSAVWFLDEEEHVMYLDAPA